LAPCGIPFEDPDVVDEDEAGAEEEEDAGAEEVLDEEEPPPQPAAASARATRATHGSRRTKFVLIVGASVSLSDVGRCAALRLR
jgi:hypothetical protein